MSPAAPVLMRRAARGGRRGLRLDEQRGDVWVHGADPLFEPRDRRLDLGGTQPVLELDAQRDDDLIRRDLESDDGIDLSDAADAACHCADRRAHRGIGALTEQQRLRFAPEQCRDDRQDCTDHQAGGPVPARIAGPQRQARARRRNMPEGRTLVGRPRGTLHAMQQQQHLVTGIDQAVHCLTQHRRRAGDAGGGELGYRYGEVADQSGNDDGLRVLRHALSGVGAGLPL